jgi:hypothetical protein
MAAMVTLGACSLEGVVLLVIVETFAAMWATCNVMRSKGIRTAVDTKVAAGPWPVPQDQLATHHLLLICDQTR